MDPDPIHCEMINLDKHRLTRLEQAIERTRRKLDVVGIRLDWLGRKLLKAELEKADLRRQLAERTWEFNLLRHRLKQGPQVSQTDTSRGTTTVRVSTVRD